MDDELLSLMEETPENVEDLYSVQEAVNQLKQVYEEISTAVEKEKEEKLRKMEKMVVAPIIALFNAGYSEITVRKLLRGIGFKRNEIDRFIHASWREMENRRRLGKIVKLVEVLVIAGVVAGLIFFGLNLFQETKAISCQSFGCSQEMLTCQEGKYYFQTADTVQEITIKKEQNYCLIRVEITKSRNEELIGRFVNCKLPIIDGTVDLSKTEGCSGSLPGPI